MDKELAEGQLDEMKRELSAKARELQQLREELGTSKSELQAVTDELEQVLTSLEGAHQELMAREQAGCSDCKSRLEVNKHTQLLFDMRPDSVVLIQDDAAAEKEHATKQSEVEVSCSCPGCPAVLLAAVPVQVCLRKELEIVKQQLVPAAAGAEQVQRELEAALAKSVEDREAAVKQNDAWTERQQQLEKEELSASLQSATREIAQLKSSLALSSSESGNT